MNPSPEFTTDLIALLSEPNSDRDDLWRSDLDEVLPDAALAPFEPSVFVAPDGFTYLAVRLPRSGESFEAISIRDSLDGCLQSGSGVALFGAADTSTARPLWICRFGDLWSLREHGSLHGDPRDFDEMKSRKDMGGQPPAEPEARENALRVALPSEELFPSYARRVVGRFLKERAGHPRPTACVVIDEQQAPSRMLVFDGVRPESFRSEDEMKLFLQLLGWHLPRTRPIAMAGDGIPAENFAEL